MKIELTEEQRQKVKLIFETFNELHEDKKFMKMLNYVNGPDFDSDKEVTEENEEDIMDLANFFENICDYANDYFNTHD